MSKSSPLLWQALIDDIEENAQIDALVVERLGHDDSPEATRWTSLYPPESDLPPQVEKELVALVYDGRLTERELLDAFVVYAHNLHVEGDGVRLRILGKVRDAMDGREKYVVLVEELGVPVGSTKHIAELFVTEVAP